ncbi:MAG: EAL domain-containing protein [Proteobacteria bacterium]|nr:EAL domain-containing protein [Pseudomonadota bacterium]
MGDIANDSEPTPQATKILLVEDSFENRDMLTRRLQRRGFTVCSATDGSTGVAMSVSEMPDVILMDVALGEMDGWQATQLIKADARTSDIPIIALTAHALASDREKSVEVGCADFDTKPAEESNRRLNEQLSQANETLELRVADRTKDLARAIERLQSEVEQRERTQATIAHLAHHDALTGLGNRLLFHKQLSEALASRKRNGDDLAVLFIDLDGFKAINDSLGHVTGDSLLKHLASRLRNALREGDKIARLGGDEFAIIQVGREQPREAGALARRLTELVGTPFVIDQQRLVIGASIGIAIAEGEYQDSEQLLRAADLAMYRAKAEGRGRFRFFEPEFDRQVQERRDLEVALRAAVEQDAIDLHYQPLVDAQTGRINGFEALARWHDPQRGFVPPSTFIPLAEEIGLIDSIGESVLRRACAEAVRWPEPISVAVNLSAAQFQSGNLIPAVKRALAASGLSPNRLELEITESIFLQGSEANLALLCKLGELGVRISMDDFGTGYSSLGYLRSFPFDKIKIDRSFIRDLPASESSVAIVRAVCGLARSFGASTTAEGVETDEQFTQVRVEGCNEVQGYIVSKPLPASEVQALLARQQPTSD